MLRNVAVRGSCKSPITEILRVKIFLCANNSVKSLTLSLHFQFPIRSWKFCFLNDVLLVVVCAEWWKLLLQRGRSQVRCGCRGCWGCRVESRHWTFRTWLQHCLHHEALPNSFAHCCSSGARSSPTFHVLMHVTCLSQFRILPFYRLLLFFGFSVAIIEVQVVCICEAIHLVR